VITFSLTIAFSLILVTPQKTPTKFLSAQPRQAASPPALTHDPNFPKTTSLNVPRTWRELPAFQNVICLPQDSAEPTIHLANIHPTGASPAKLWFL
jgi:hypothetical protein